MGNPELSHQIGQAAHNAKEAGRVLLDSNLFQNLQDIGHPYGLLLNQTSKTDSAEFSGKMFEFFTNDDKADFIGVKKGISRSTPTGGKNLFKIVFSFPCMLMANYWLKVAVAPSISSGSINTVLYETTNLIKAFRGKETDKSDGIFKDTEDFKGHLSNVFSVGSLATALSKMPFIISAKLNENIAEKLNLELLNKLSVFAPNFTKSLDSEYLSQARQTEFHIGHSGVSLGTSSIHLKDYKGEKPFIVKTPQGEPVAQINPGDSLGSMHVSRQAGFLRKLSPLEKIQVVTSDILSLFTAIDKPEQSDLNSKQQETLNRTQSATIIGISHLTRLLRRKTGLPTWNLDVLPEAVQKLHQFDSQAVSNQFGGGRKVKPGDIEMLVITPDQRQMLAAAAV